MKITYENTYIFAILSASILASDLTSRADHGSVCGSEDMNGAIQKVCHSPRGEGVD